MEKKIWNILIFIIPLSLLFSCGNDSGKKEKNDEETYKYTNQLINETSPYLLDHAHNPVNWEPWDESAFEKAKAQDKLVIISIGYSSCHWCHVMEEETFEDEEVAGIMNEEFINIKVDREERPDIDEVYMTAINLIKGSGGWPLNVIALPDGKPIYTGTYHTKEQWKDVLTKINASYQENPERARDYASMVAEGIQQSNFVSVDEEPAKLQKSDLVNFVDKWSSNWDQKWGGDIGAQKFMLPSTYGFLLDYALMNDDLETLQHVKNSLDLMGNRGVYDHIGGGFFRYSIDAEWNVPHYEKMLYDNAQLLSLYSRAYRALGEEEYRKVAKGVAEFLFRSMRNPEGGFYAAIDADSEGEEGKFYTWKREELEEALGSDFSLFSDYYILHPEPGTEGKYVVFKSGPDSEFLEKNSLSTTELKAKKESWKSALEEMRVKRVHPAIDDKMIISWNALLISGFVEAYKAFGDKTYLDTAVSIYDFIQDKGMKNGKLIHSYKKGGREVNGFLDDYVYLMSASLELFSVTQDQQYLDFSKTLLDQVEENFSNDREVFYRYSENEDLISPILKIDDGVLPSPNAVMAENLFLLGHLFYKDEWNQKSGAMLAAMQPAIEESPAAYAKWNHTYLKHTFNFLEIAVVGEKAGELSLELEQQYFPNSLIAASTSESDIPLFEERYMAGETYIYVCENRSCKRPVSTLSEAEDLIQEIR
ncbi:thioredoxin domain-containing protein [Gramella sp. BOM4]|nr:thioredoxin domain-containing protein [Christiangramia bathymodioli]